ncbi:MAG: glycosyltransferase family 4 protein [Sulfuriferula sp.]
MDALNHKPLTVLQILPALQGGGVERGTLEVARHLVHHGHRALVMSAGGRMVAQLESEGASHFTWPIGKKSLFTLRLVARLRRFLVEQRVDILHVRSRMPGWIAYLAWRGMNPATRPKLVTTVHGLYSVNRYSKVMLKGERIIAVSNTIRDYILRNYPDTDPNRIQVIYRGVEATEFPYGYQPTPDWLAAWRALYPQLAGKRIITLPGRLTRLKGHEAFIELIDRLKQCGLPVHGLIVGGEDPKRLTYARELHQAVATHGLAADITFTGHRSDMREVFAASDIVLSLSSKPESFGRTVLEALRLGTPVVGYNHGGVGEILATAYPAGLTELGKMDALIERVTALLKQPVAVADQGAYPLTSMLDDTLAIYLEVIE